MDGCAPLALLLTDLVDSTALAERLGEAAWAKLSNEHDQAARALLRQWHGREIDKTDGFLLIFDRVADALSFALAYHRLLPVLHASLRARAGLHVGRVVLRSNARADVAQGAKPLEVDGANKALAARVMSIALGGQTLLTGDARAALGDSTQRIVSHGHWRLKGLADPVALFEAGDDGAPFMPPPDGDKAYRVARHGDLWQPVRRIAHSLPAQRDAFVGRTTALRAIASSFDGGARLVTVLGPGGSGKTRLATRFGWAWLGDYPGGVWFCDLVPARTMQAVLQAVARGLQVRLGDVDAMDQLSHAICARGRCLLILDNFEQVSRHAEQTLGRWLESAAQASFLVTSREVLGIQGEETYALAPLAQAEAVELFTRRATARHGYHLAGDEQPVLDELMRLLDGLPLAIELAAARVRILPPRALLARMNERFKLLAVADDGRGNRQATLRATFDWSWELLGPSEKSALAQLSVFEGGFTLQAMEGVVDLSSCADVPWTADVLQSLVDKSFVRSLASERFDLLVSVRAYTAEHLYTAGRYDGSGPAAELEAMRRHGVWFAARGVRRALSDGCADLANLVVACQRATAHGWLDTAVGSLEGAWAALSLNGPFGAGVELADTVCAMAGLQGATAARAFTVCGSIYGAVGRGTDARQRLDAALALARDAAERRLEAAAGVELASLDAREGRLQQAVDGHLRSLAVARQLGDAAIECASLSGLGNAEFDQGRLSDAQEHYEAGLIVARELQDKSWQCALLGNLGMLHANIGRMAEARTQLEQAIELARQLGDHQREGNTLCNLGMLHLVEKRPAPAIEVSLQALAVARQLGHVRLECVVLCNLALALQGSDRLAEALQRFDAALQVARALRDRVCEGQVLGYIGQTHVRQRAFAVAHGFLQSAETLLRQGSDPLSLAVLLCSRAECEWAEGNAAGARHAFDEAQRIAQDAGALEQSELGVALAQVSSLLRPAGGAPAAP